MPVPPVVLPSNEFVCPCTVAEGCDKNEFSRPPQPRTEWSEWSEWSTGRRSDHSTTSTTAPCMREGMEMEKSTPALEALEGSGLAFEVVRTERATSAAESAEFQGI